MKLTTRHTINNYLKGYDINGMDPKRPDWVVQAREVLVPATSLSKRVVARFNPDSCPEFQQYTSPWRKAKVKGRLHAFRFRNNVSDKNVSRELKQWNDHKCPREYCQCTQRMVELAKTIVDDFEPSPAITPVFDLLEIVRGICAPGEEDGEWLDKSLLDGWTASPEAAKETEDITEDLKAMNIGGQKD